MPIISPFYFNFNKTSRNSLTEVFRYNSGNLAQTRVINVESQETSLAEATRITTLNQDACLTVRRVLLEEFELYLLCTR